MRNIALNILGNTIIRPRIVSYAKQSGLRSMQNISGVEREMIEAYRGELTHEIWGDPVKLSEWVANKFIELRNKDYSSLRLSKESVIADRNESVKIWSDIIDENTICQSNPFIKLKILRSVISDLKPDNAQLPPVINLNVFDDAVYEVKKSGSSFKKTYYKLFKQFHSVPGLVTDNMTVNGVSGSWYSLHLPDYATSVRQPGIFNKIKDFISVLSQRSNWCTRNTKNLSNDFIGKDFHIFIDNKGIPQICIVGSDANGGRFKYICGNDQYAKIPDKYKGVLKEFLKLKQMDNAVVGETDAKIRPVIDIFG